MGGVRIPVPDWGAGSSLVVDMWVTADDGVVRPGKYPLTANKPLTLLVPIKKKGTLTFGIDIETETPYKDVFSRNSLPLRQAFRFQITADGDVLPIPRGVVNADWDHFFNVDIDFKTWRNNYMGWPGYRVKAPNELRVLHVAMDVDIQVTSKPGRIGVGYTDYQDSLWGNQNYPDPPGSTGFGKAWLGDLVVELVQPVSKLQGLYYRVQFGKDSPKIEPPQGDLLDKFIQESLLDTYEIRVALLSGLLPFRGEASASATYKGSPADRSKYNQELSEKRKAAVVDWLTKEKAPNPTPNLIKAIGDSMSKLGEEDPNQRRCDLSIKGEELTWVVQQLWLANKYLNR